MSEPTKVPDPVPVEEPEEPIVEPDSDVSSITNPDDESEGLFNVPMPPEAYANQMLMMTMAQFFIYSDEEGNTANVADLLAMIKHSIDKNSKCIKNLSDELAELKGVLDRKP